MKDLMRYVDEALANAPNTKSMYQFKKELVNGLTERANELTHAGLSDEKVIYDIITGEHPDIAAEYKEKEKEKKAKRRKKNMAVLRVAGSALYLLTAVVVFLAVNLSLHAWGRTWVFLVAALMVFVSYIIFLAVVRLTRRRSMFHPLSRILIAVNVFIYTTAVFLILAVTFRVPHAWLTFIFGVLVMMTVDGIYAEKAAERFAIFFHLAYIVPASVMIYIILATLGVVGWHPGWIMIPGSLIIVLAVILFRIYVHGRDTGLEETEEDGEWTAD